MRYVTATIGAMFVFVAVLVVSFVLNAFVPPAFQAARLHLGAVVVWGSPIVLLGFVVAVVAAVHSFRSSLKPRKRKPDNAQA
jgi:hypothetical protein